MASLFSYSLGSFGTVKGQSFKEEEEAKVLPNLDPKFFEQEELDHEAETARRCLCTFPAREKNLQGWELYRPQSQYINTNISTKPSSTAALRRLVTDRSLKRVINGRPTVLGHLIAGMRKSPPPPLYEYGNCLRSYLDFNEFKSQDNFELKQVVKHIPITNDVECYQPKSDKEPLSIRKNPFRELQLCPKSMYDLILQPPRQEAMKRTDILLDVRKY